MSTTDATAPSKDVPDTMQRRKSGGSLDRKSLSRITMRKKSFGFSSIIGLKPIQSTQGTTEYKRPILAYHPTYQLNSLKPFHLADVTFICERVLDILFTDHKYHGTDSPQLAMLISMEIMRRVKERRYNRYRVIAVTTIGQKRSQSYNNAIAFLWDHERDAYVDIHRENFSVFIQVTVFGIYLD